METLAQGQVVATFEHIFSTLKALEPRAWQRRATKRRAWEETRRLGILGMGGLVRRRGI